MPEKINSHVLSVIVKDNYGILGRITGLFARRCYSIQSIIAAETEIKGISRITIVAEGDEHTLEQIDKQLSKLHEVVEVKVLDYSRSVCREHVLIKAGNSEESRTKLVDIANLFKAKVVDVGENNIMLELTGEPGTIEAFIRLVKPYGIIKLVKTGITALERG